MAIGSQMYGLDRAVCVSKYWSFVTCLYFVQLCGAAFATATLAATLRSQAILALDAANSLVRGVRPPLFSYVSVSSSCQLRSPGRQGPVQRACRPDLCAARREGREGQEDRAGKTISEREEILFEKEVPFIVEKEYAPGLAQHGASAARIPFSPPPTARGASSHRSNGRQRPRAMWWAGSGYAPVAAARTKKLEADARVGRAERLHRWRPRRLGSRRDGERRPAITAQARASPSSQVKRRTHASADNDRLAAQSIVCAPSG